MKMENRGWRIEDRSSIFYPLSSILNFHFLSSILEFSLAKRRHGVSA